MIRRFSSLFALFLFVLPKPGQPADWYVHAESGKDTAQGTLQDPCGTIQHAGERAQPGDTIHLLPRGAVYRQMILLKDKHDLTIRGNDCILTGADPLPMDGWEKLNSDLHRRQVPVAKWGRPLLVVRGRVTCMGNSASVNRPYPAPAMLRVGEFSWQPIDGKTGWLTVRGNLHGLELAVRPAGVATAGSCRKITIHDLHARHATNDGFNIHGDCRQMYFRHVTGYECFDEGLSAHDTCEVFVEDGEFWGNDQAVADVNAADSYYTRCRFRDSVSAEVVFRGGTHRLEECTIVAAAPTAFSLTAGKNLKSQEISLPTCTIIRSTFRSNDARSRQFVLDSEGTLDLRGSVLQRISLQLKGKFSAHATTVDGRPFP
ncbi:MAG: hypothetical protein DMG07_20135 [Acidobacteria bacterium]|nr:MAG: hypothetical protein DMG07_20135 [Acidobacteriota bacterium]